MGEGVCGDDSKPHRFLSADRQLGAALRDGVGNHFIVDGFTFNDAAQDRNSVKPFLQKRGRQDGQLKSTWGGEFRKRQTASSGVVCLLRTLTEPVDDLGVPIGTHNGDTRGGWHGGQGGWGGLTHEDMILRGGPFVRAGGMNPPVEQRCRAAALSSPVIPSDAKAMNILPEAIAKRRAEIWGPIPFPHGKTISDCLPELFCDGRIQHVHLSPDAMDEPGEALLAAIESAVQDVPAGVGGRLEVEKTNGELVGYLTLPSDVVDLSIQATSVPYAQDVVIPIRPRSRAAG